jgi:1-acyl-sn-glycerol-3-phosphate acyltransferase
MSPRRGGQNLRAAMGVMALLLTTLVAMVAVLAGAVLLPGSERRLRWRNTCVRSWSRALAALLQMRITVRGAAPRPPFLLVSNHVSYLDILVLGSRLDCTFLAKSEVAKWPLFGWASRSAGTIFVARDSKRELRAALAEMDRCLSMGMGLVLFPEGTTTSGAQVAPFKPALLENAARRELPVHYASIRYRNRLGGEPPSRAICWWGDAGFGGHLFRVFRQRGFVAKIAFGAMPVRNPDRKNLAQQLHAGVVESFIPMR